jgi:thioredoxin reductase (NADPH)
MTEDTNTPIRSASPISDDRVDGDVDVVVVGAGPVGLACALEVQRRGLDTVVVEKGALVNSLVGYPTNMEFFSTPDLLEIGGHPFPTSRYKPIREEAIDYYRGVSQAEDLNIRLYERVTGLEGERGAFVVRTDKGSIRGRFVIAATGFFDVPNPLNVPGEDLDKVSHYFKEPYAFTGLDVAVVGAKNSAAKAALQCFRHGARVTMIVRREEIHPNVKYWLRPDLINRIGEGSITAWFRSDVTRITPEAIEFRTPAEQMSIRNDVVLAMTGYRPDYSFLRSLGIDAADDDARTPVHSEETFETNRPGVFLAGTVCGGLRTSRWFIENGRHHARVIARRIAEFA